MQDNHARRSAAILVASLALAALAVAGCRATDRAPGATRIDRLTFNEVIDKRLKIMDVSAIDLCQRNGIPIIVLNLKKEGNMRAVVCGADVGTLINDG